MNGKQYYVVLVGILAPYTYLRCQSDCVFFELLAILDPIAKTLKVVAFNKVDNIFCSFI